MTKAELIRKLAHKFGVPDSEAKIFFEIFLQNASAILNPGEAVNIKTLGFFQFRKGKIKSTSGTGKENLPEAYSDLIVYSPFENTVNDPGSMLIFNVPSQKEVVFNNVDAYFSLSFGKPVIPLRDVKNTEFFIPATGYELRRLLESKVENLLANSELIKKYTRGSEFLFINPEVHNQIEINWDDVSQKEKMSKTQEENIPWNFGEDIEKEIEEESILDIEKEESVIIDKDINWQFNETEQDDKNEETDKNEIKAEDLKNFKRVKSLTKGFGERNTHGWISKAEDELSWNFQEVPGDHVEEKGDEDIYKHYADTDERKDEQGFIEVKNKRKTYDIELSPNDQQRLDSIIKNELKNIDDAEDEINVADNFYKETDEKIKEVYTPQLVEEKETFPVRRSAPVFIIALSVIVLVGAALFIYLRDGGILTTKKTSKQVVAKSSVPPVEITRTYEIPVNYPYTKKESIAGPGLPVKTGSETEETQTETAVNLNKPVTGTDYTSVKIKDYLYKDGDTYSVQVSSWKSKTKAENEAEKIRNKGFQSVVERVEISGKGFWYRVKMVNFKTQEEAEKYLN